MQFKLCYILHTTMALDDSSRMPKDPVTCFQCVIDSHTGRMRIVKSVLLRTLLEPLTGATAVECLRI